MSSPRPKKLEVSKPKQVRALASRVRLELLTALVAIGPCSISDLAHALNRPADGLYRHVRVLLSAGLAVRTGTRLPPERGRRREMVIDAAADHFAVDYDPITGRNAAGFHKINQAIVRSAAHSLIAAEQAQDLVVDGPRKNIFVNSDVAWLSPKDVATVVTSLQQIDSIFSRSRTPDAEGVTRLFTLTSIFVPVIRTGREADGGGRRRGGSERRMGRGARETQ